MGKSKNFKKKVKRVKSNVVNNSPNEIQKNIKTNNQSSSQEFINAPDKSSLISVKKYREKMKKLGFKQISVYLPSDVYKKLKLLKFYSNKGYADILERLINEEFEKFKNKINTDIINF